MIAKSGAPLLRIASVVKRFGGVTAVDDLSLDIAAGEFFALLGPSGCGKTTLLRMLAGFETPDAGAIHLDGQDIAHVMPHERPVNMMFQNYALFPHLSVEGNISFGLKRAGLPKDEIASRVAEMIALVRLEGLQTRRPDQLSGGQRQRVALARSLARRPQVLLLDEPLGALDKKLRESTQSELMELQRRVVQVAPPRELYEAPNSRWVAGFVGDINLIEGRVTAIHRDLDRVVVTTSQAGVTVAARTQVVSTGDAVCLAIRPEKITLTAGDEAAGAGGTNSFAGVLTDINYIGGLSMYRVRLDSGAMLKVARANARRTGDRFASGQRVSLSFAPEDVVVLDR